MALPSPDPLLFPLPGVQQECPRYARPDRSGAIRPFCCATAPSPLRADTPVGPLVLRISSEVPGGKGASGSGDDRKRERSLKGIALRAIGFLRRSGRCPLALGIGLASVLCVNCLAKTRLPCGRKPVKAPIVASRDARPCRGDSLSPTRRLLWIRQSRGVPGFA